MEAIFRLQNNTNESAAALVDDTAESFGELCARVIGDMRELAVKPLVDKLVERFSEHIGVPDLAGIGLEFAEQEVDKLLGLLFRTDDGRNLRFDIRLDHMDAGCGRVELDTVAARLLDHLRFFELHVVDIGNDDTVARGIDVVERLLDLIVLLFHVGKLKQELKERFIILDGKAREFTDQPVEKSVCKLHVDRCSARAKVDSGDPNVLDIGIFRCLRKALDDVARLGNARGASGDRFVNTAVDRVRAIERIHKVGEIDGDLRHGEFQQHKLKDMTDIVFVKLKTVDERNGCAIFLLQGKRKRDRLRAFGA